MTDETLKAIEELIAHYSMFNPNIQPPCMFPCPLCELHRPYTDSPSVCTTCPWTRYEKSIPFTGTLCVAYGFTGQTTTQRLERLNRWKKEIASHG